MCEGGKSRGGGEPPRRSVVIGSREPRMRASGMRDRLGGGEPRGRRCGRARRRPPRTRSVVWRALRLYSRSHTDEVSSKAIYCRRRDNERAGVPHTHKRLATARNTNFRGGRCRRVACGVPQVRVEVQGLALICTTNAVPLLWLEWVSLRGTGAVPYWLYLKTTGGALYAKSPCRIIQSAINSATTSCCVLFCRRQASRKASFSGRGKHADTVP